MKIYLLKYKNKLMRDVCVNVEGGCDCSSGSYDIKVPAFETIKDALRFLRTEDWRFGHEVAYRTESGRKKKKYESISSDKFSIILREYDKPDEEALAELSAEGLKIVEH